MTLMNRWCPPEQDLGTPGPSVSTSVPRFPTLVCFQPRREGPGDVGADTLGQAWACCPPRPCPSCGHRPHRGAKEAGKCHVAMGCEEEGRAGEDHSHTGSSGWLLRAGPPRRNFHSASSPRSSLHFLKHRLLSSQSSSLPPA